MKSKSIIFIFVVFLWFCVPAPFTQGEEVFFDPQLMAYTGKTYEGFEDPEYAPYHSALKEYMVKRIQQQFGVTLDAKTYSGFDLLEIEALLKCKKPDEPADIFLKMFPKYR